MVERTLREFVAPDMNIQTLCIQYPNLDVQCEFKSGLVHLLPKFRGPVDEALNKHLKKFHIVCTTMKLFGVSNEHIKLKMFLSSLQDTTKDWLYYLLPGSITTWESLKRMFLKNFFHASWLTAIWKEICGIKQLDEESLYEYWERLKRICKLYTSPYSWATTNPVLL